MAAHRIHFSFFWRVFSEPSPGRPVQVNKLFLMCIGSLLSIVVYFAVRRWRYNSEVTLDEIRYRILPVDRDLLIEIKVDSLAWLSAKKDYGARRDVRSALDDVKEQFHRISTNAERVRDCASYYRSISERQRSEEALEDQELGVVVELEARVEAIERALKAAANLDSMLRRVLVAIWIWDMSAFHKREWGPVPDLARLRISEVLEAYERVKMAAVHLAQACGEGVVSQQLSEQM